VTVEGAIEEGDVSRLLQSIRERYGYDLRGYAAPSIRRRVAAALGRLALSSVNELEERVLGDPTCFAGLLEILTVRVSEMFRDPPLFRAFRTKVVPFLKTFPRLNIWHAGCATGEEAYSMAILLAEEGLYERTQIYATDLSPRAIEQAKAGIYPAALFERFGASYREAGGFLDLGCYTAQAYQGLSIRPWLRRNILFFQHDLVCDHVFGEMDVVFCRNVLIYFGRHLQERVGEKLDASLRAGGVLCLGPSEQIPRELKEQYVELGPSLRMFRRSRPSGRRSLPS
jgi:chemotaxis protein methyltransferase CheR